MANFLGISYRKNPTTLYHVSFNDSLPEVLNPQLPAGSELATGDEKYPEPEVDRVCLAETVTGCIRAMWPNISKMVVEEGHKVLTMHVYEAVDLKKTKMYSPEVLAQIKYVWDAELTGEWWSVEPVKIRHLRKIEVHFDTNGKWTMVKPYGTEAEVEHSPGSIVIKELK
tara:strand:- start:1338 stop:1844 length:507 start_codon:yes stop_codon:yes gene_type:complete